MNAAPHDSTSDGAPQIAIIGGGITGLAAAHRLQDLLPRAQWTLFEASDRLGGVLDTVRSHGFLIERSADNFLTEPPTATELCREVGMADQLVQTSREGRRALVVRDGRLLPIPNGFYLMSPRRLWPLLTSPLLSWRGKLRLLSEPFVPRGRDDDESVASFVCRRLGREAFERIVQPLVAGIYTADPEKLSMAATMPQFLEYERRYGSLLRATWRSTRVKSPQRASHTSDEMTNNAEPETTDHASGPRYGLFAAPQDGMASLVKALAAQLPAGRVQLGTAATCVSCGQNGRWKISRPGAKRIGPREAESFDAVILAVPAHASARLLEATDPSLSAELAAIPYAGCVVVGFGFERCQIAHALDGFGFVVPQREGRRIVAASFASSKYPGRAPHDCVLVRVFLGGALQPEMVQLSDANLRRIAREELSALLTLTGEPLVTDIARWPASMPQYHVGHLERVARIERLVARWPGIVLAGNAYHGVGIPQCIASGQAAAERAALHVGRSRNG